jgi:hypothetical protein
VPTILWAGEEVSWGELPAGWEGVDVPPDPDTASLELDGEVLSLDDFVSAGLICTSIDLGWPAVRVVSQARGQVDGAIDTTSQFGARPVTIALAAVDTDERSWKAALAGLTRFLSAGSRPTLVLHIDGVDYRMVLAPDIASAPFEFPHHARAQIAFRAPDPFLYGPAQFVSSGSFVAGVAGRTYPWTTPRVYPVTDAVSGQVLAVNGGSSTVWPIVNVWGPLATSFTLTNDTTGETFSISTVTVDAGHRLEVDMRERTVRIDGSAEASRFSLVNFATSSWVHLAPGDNLVRFSTGTASDAVASIEWSDPHLLPGGLPL